MPTRNIGRDVQQIYARSWGPGIIANYDILATLYFGNSRSVDTAGDQIPPLGWVAVDGSKDLWGSTLSSSVIFVQSTPGATSWTPPPILVAEQQAAEFNIIGIPPVDKPAAMFVVFNQPIGAGATVLLPPVSAGFPNGQIPVGQYQSWSGKMFALSSTGSPVTPYVRVTQSYSVASDNYDPQEPIDFVIPSAPFNFNYNYENYGHGPLFGDSEQLIVTNYDSASVQFTIGLFGSYRTRSRTVWRGAYHWNAGGSENEALGLGTDDILIASGSLPAIAAGGFTPAAPGYLLNLFEGPATVSAQINMNGNAAGTVLLVISPQPQSATPGAYYIAVPASGIVAPTAINLPRRVCTMQIINNGANPTIAGGFVLVTGQVQPE